MKEKKDNGTQTPILYRVRNTNQNPSVGTPTKPTHNLHNSAGTPTRPAYNFHNYVPRGKIVISEVAQAQTPTPYYTSENMSSNISEDFVQDIPMHLWPTRLPKALSVVSEIGNYFTPITPSAERVESSLPRTVETPDNVSNSTDDRLNAADILCSFKKTNLDM